MRREARMRLSGLRTVRAPQQVGRNVAVQKKKRKNQPTTQIRLLSLFVSYLHLPFLLTMHSRMARHATDLPELRQHIARHSDLATLKACSLVCKAWNLDVHSILWKSFVYAVPERCS